MSYSTRLVWIDVELHPYLSNDIERRRALGLLFQLALCLLLLTMRHAWCQAQAYAAIWSAIVAFVAHRAAHCDVANKLTSSDAKRYCTTCCSENGNSVAVGVERAPPSYYERLFYRPVALAHIAFTISAWIAYGALFHEGAHTTLEDALLVESRPRAELGTGALLLPETLPWLLRNLRVLALVTLAAFSGALVKGVRSWRFERAHVVLFVALLLLPDSRSTPQALAGSQLALRSALFVALFWASEQLERARAHLDFVSHYTQASSALLLSVMMANREARRSRLSEERAAESSSLAIEANAGRTAVRKRHSMLQTPIELHQRRTSDAVLSGARSLLRSAWVLMCAPIARNAPALSLLCLLVVLAWLVRARTHSAALLQRKLAFLRLDGVDAGAEDAAESGVRSSSGEDEGADAGTVARSRETVQQSARHDRTRAHNANSSRRPRPVGARNRFLFAENSESATDSECSAEPHRHRSSAAPPVSLLPDRNGRALPIQSVRQRRRPKRAKRTAGRARTPPPPPPTEKARTSPLTSHDEATSVSATSVPTVDTTTTTRSDSPTPTPIQSPADEFIAVLNMDSSFVSQTAAPLTHANGSASGHVAPVKKLPDELFDRIAAASRRVSKSSKEQD